MTKRDALNSFSNTTFDNISCLLTGLVYRRRGEKSTSAEPCALYGFSPQSHRGAEEPGSG